MDFDYMGRLLLSVAIFAPGLIILTLLAFVGLLVLIEKAGLFGKSAKHAGKALETVPASGANPAPGRVVSDLSEAIATEGADSEATGAAEAEIRHIGNSG